MSKKKQQGKKAESTGRRKRKYGMDWGRILRDAGIPEPPGRVELVERLEKERESQEP